MKKYFLMLLLFLGCFFVGLSIDASLVEAVNATVTTDSYNSRKITINLTDVDVSINKLVVSEAKACKESEEGCVKIEYTSDKQSMYVKLSGTKSYTRIAEDRTATVEYTITSPEDGEKYIYIAAYRNEILNINYSYLVTYNLSTLNERLVVNPDGNGKPLYEFDEIQYTPVRKLPFNINFVASELTDTYSGLVYVCEVEKEEAKEGEKENEFLRRCGEFLVGSDVLEYYVASFGDGFKKLNFYLAFKGKTINLDNSNLFEEFKDKAKPISKEVYLDTIGPEIIVEGGNWVYLEAGKTYTPKTATCQDAIFKTQPCTVTNDSNIVTIKYNTSDYQIITYEGTDAIGNVSSVSVKIKVELASDNNDWIIYLVSSIGIFLVVLIILAWVLIKNNEKKKKLSYI